MPKAGILTTLEDLFLDAYISNGFNRRKAVKDAGIKCGDPSSYGARMLKKEHVQKELNIRLDKQRNKFFVSEMDIMEGLYKEAKLEKADGGSQQGRIQAWVHLGKQLGMFNDKVKELEAKGKGGTNIQIINYNAPISKEEPQALEGEIVSETELAIEHMEPQELLEGVKLADYTINKNKAK